jgi:lactobin A/cerein 7B family class IIb bacteriocin
MKTLDTLTTLGSELTSEQLDDVDGGCVLLVCGVIWALGTFDTVMIWGMMQ